jgi:geranylgeranyl diphosphate synthase, type III
LVENCRIKLYKLFHNVFPDIIHQKPESLEEKKHCVSIMEKIGTKDYCKSILEEFDKELRRECERLTWNPVIEKFLDGMTDWKDPSQDHQSGDFN